MAAPDVIVTVAIEPEVSQSVQTCSSGKAFDDPVSQLHQVSLQCQFQRGERVYGILWQTGLRAISTSGGWMRPTEARARRWYLIWKTAGPLLILSGYLLLPLARGESHRAAGIAWVTAALALAGGVGRGTFVLLQFLERYGRFAHYPRWALAGNPGGGAVVALFPTAPRQEPT